MAGFTVVKHTDVLLQKIRGNARAAIQAAGETVVEAVQTQMLYGYERPPVDTGRLFDSIEAGAVRGSQNLVTVAVGTRVLYGGFVHDGTYKIPPRPFMRDALMNPDTQEKIGKTIAEKMAEGF